jgi:NAD(P)-dependent dehydrogenase (short-subunit alcohol dehydrogenase family)
MNTTTVHATGTGAFAGRLALLTGGSSGIGAAAARQLAAEGARLALLGRDQAAAQAVLDELPSHAPGGLPVACDVTDEASVETAVAAVIERLGPPDVAVLSAGLLVRAPAEETSLAVWDEVLAVNLTGVFLVAREMAQHMRRAGRGSIVMVSSEAGLRGIRGLAAYSVAKAGVVELARCMALDLADAGVRVNCVCPGTTRTPMVLNSVAQDPDPVAALQRYATVRPLQRLGTPEEIAAAIVFLASDAAAYATGSVLAVDGGYTA